jgi:hypothetical protein
MIRISTFGFVALTLFAAGCSAEPEENTENFGSADELRVRPKDKENQARITFSLPTGTCARGGGCARPAGLKHPYPPMLDGNTFSLGTAIRVSPGEHTFTVNGLASKVVLKAGEVRNYVLAVAHRKCIAAAPGSIPVADFGKQLDVSNLACPQRAAFANMFATFADDDYAYPAGTYTYEVGGQTRSFTLAEGALAEIPVALDYVGALPAMFATTIKYADTAELGDATQGKIQIDSICQNQGVTFNFSVPYGVGVRAGRSPLNLKAFVDSACTHTLNVAGRKVEISKTTPNDFTLQRLDVDDVTITREDGSTYITGGTFELFFGGNHMMWGSTNSGLDLLPGTYELVINYTTVEGPKTQRQTFTL